MLCLFELELRGSFMCIGVDVRLFGRCSVFKYYRYLSGQEHKSLCKLLFISSSQMFWLGVELQKSDRRHALSVMLWEFFFLFLLSLLLKDHKIFKKIFKNYKSKCVWLTQNSFRDPSEKIQFLLILGALEENLLPFWENLLKTTFATPLSPFFLAYSNVLLVATCREVLCRYTKCCGRELSREEKCLLPSAGGNEAGFEMFCLSPNSW